MSQENVELVRRLQPSGGINLVYHGLAGFARGWREWLEAWTSYRIEVEDFIDAGDKVVSLVRVAARTARDDVLMHHTPGAVWTIRDGKVASIHFYLDRSEALEAAGVADARAERR
jgi:ketosteroid isomerase-like protein